MSEESDSTDIESPEDRHLVRRIVNLTKGAIGDSGLAITRFFDGLEVQKQRAEYVEQRMDKCPHCGGKINFKERMVALSDEFDELRLSKTVKGTQTAK